MFEILRTKQSRPNKEEPGRREFSSQRPLLQEDVA